MKSIKMLAAVAAFLAPIALGWAYTGGASIDGILGDDEHTVDEWNGPEGYEDYRIERDNNNGVVTVTVTDPSGNLVPLADLPAGIAAEADYIQNEWEPRNWDDTEFFGTRDGVSCYHVVDDAPLDDMHEMVWNANGHIRYHWQWMDADGNLTAEAMEWQPGDLSDADHETISQAQGVRMADLVPQGLALNPC